MLGNEYTEKDAESLYRVSQFPGVYVWIRDGFTEDTFAVVTKDEAEPPNVLLESSKWCCMPIQAFDCEILVLQEIDCRTSTLVQKSLDMDSRVSKGIQKIASIADTALFGGKKVSFENALTRILDIAKKLG